jgi:hypothetical protein
MAIISLYKTAGHRQSVRGFFFWKNLHSAGVTGPVFRVNTEDVPV